MDQKTEVADIAGFYDRISGDYDRMTGFEQRFVRERPFIKMLVDRHGIQTALDAGTGTGFHALLLAQLGVHVTAVDISPTMIAALDDRAAAMGIAVTTLVASFRELPERVREPQDAIFSLGNTMAHASSYIELVESLVAFLRVLKPGGTLLLQLLNYKRILASRESTQIVREEGNTRFVRWYSYEGTRIRFNITREYVDGEQPPTTISVLLTPFTDDDLRGALLTAGFGDIRSYGSIALEAFETDCVVLAQVPVA
jgi:ubiquinone/menaquinone biosynthesis C-methylase UbiE